MPAAVTRMRTWPGPGSGGSSSTSCSTSTGSPASCTCHARIRRRLRPRASVALVEQEIHLGAEELVDRLVGPALEELRVAALEHHGELPPGEHVVPAELADVPTRRRGVALDQLVAIGQVLDRERRFLGHAESHRALRSGVEDERPREVDERVADGRHLPVDHREEPRWRLGREQHVVELVVAVAERERLVRRAVRTEPLRDPAGGREVAALVGVELVQPPVDLAGEVPVAARREVAETAGSASPPRARRPGRRRAAPAPGRATRERPPTPRAPTRGSAGRRSAPSRRRARRTRRGRRRPRAGGRSRPARP